MLCLNPAWTATLVPVRWISHIQRHSTTRDGRGHLGVSQACVWVCISCISPSSQTVDLFKEKSPFTLLERNVGGGWHGGEGLNC